MDGVSGKGIVFIPVKDPNGSYLPLESGAGTHLCFCELLCFRVKVIKPRQAKKWRVIFDSQK
uniref:Uncharacterized protein n=1 Tax=Arundo donax TaxID=35708 RepID=A0A0A9GII7_ARUDO